MEIGHGGVGGDIFETPPLGEDEGRGGGGRVQGDVRWLVGWFTEWVGRAAGGGIGLGTWGNGHVGLLSLHVNGAHSRHRMPRLILSPLISGF